MAWQQLVIEPAQLDLEALEATLFEIGALAVSIEDAGDEPILEPDPGSTPMWSQPRVRALFAAETELDVVREQLALLLGLERLPEYREETLPERQWERVWLERFNAAMPFGDRLWVCPGDHRPDRDDAVCVLLDPGLAFGTGTHPSTAGCLRWLDANPPHGQRVLDYGCGSGILAISALKLGAERAVCVDNDPQALTATATNAERNGVSGRVLCTLPTRLAACGYDLILANILARPLMALAPRLAALAAPQARIVLAGILAAQADAVATCYAPFFALQTTRLDHEWVRLHGRRPAHAE